MIRKLGAHCPINNAQSSLPLNLKMADTAIAPIAAARYPEEGIFAVCDSIEEVMLSSRSPDVRRESSIVINSDNLSRIEFVRKAARLNSVYAERRSEHHTVLWVHVK